MRTTVRLAAIVVGAFCLGFFLRDVSVSRLLVSLALFGAFIGSLAAAWVIVIAVKDAIKEAVRGLIELLEFSTRPLAVTRVSIFVREAEKGDMPYLQPPRTWLRIVLDAAATGGASLLWDERRPKAPPVQRSVIAS